MCKKFNTLATYVFSKNLKAPSKNKYDYKTGFVFEDLSYISKQDGKVISLDLLISAWKRKVASLDEHALSQLQEPLFLKDGDLHKAKLRLEMIEHLSQLWLDKLTYYYLSPFVYLSKVGSFSTFSWKGFCQALSQLDTDKQEVIYFLFESIDFTGNQLQDLQGLLFNFKIPFTLNLASSVAKEQKALIKSFLSKHPSFIPVIL